MQACTTHPEASGANRSRRAGGKPRPWEGLYLDLRLCFWLLVMVVSQLVRVSIAAIKHHDQRQLEGGDFISFYSLTVTEARAGTGAEATDEC